MITFFIGFLIASLIYYIETKFHCWYLGCESNGYQQWPRCKRCGDECSYEDLIGDTRHNRVKEFLRYWLFRKWFPAKCSSCGHRYHCDESVDHLPF